jgi:hypothetical protein
MLADTSYLELALPACHSHLAPPPHTEQYRYIFIAVNGQVPLVRLVLLVCLVCLQTDNFCLFLCKQTDKGQSSVCTMSKRMNENCLGFRFPFETAAYICRYICCRVIINIWKTGTSVCLLQTENGKLLFVFCKRKTEVCFPWSANDKR